MMLLGELHRILRTSGISPSRKLSQNFLVNDHIAGLIASEAAAGGSVLEIGPGVGALTEKLVGRCSSLTLVEVSRQMVEVLHSRFAGEDVAIENADFLEVNPSVLPGYPFDVITGNLPYSISSPIIFRLVEESFSEVKKVVIMLQREVAARLSCLGGGKDYGRMSLQIWPFFHVHDLVDAVPEDFYPAPEVHSRVVVLKRRDDPKVSPALFPEYRKLVRISFATRRKNLLNNLKPHLGREGSLELLGRAGIDPGLRAEQIPPESFVRLAECWR